MRNPERFARYVAAVREWRDDHRECCRAVDGWLAVDAALKAYDAGQWTRRARLWSRVVEGDGYTYSLSSARSARWVFRALAERAA